MEQHDNGYHYYSYKQWEHTLHQPYDYKHEGLLKRLMSRKISQTDNPILKSMLGIVESACVFCLQYIGILNNFHNYNKYNR